MSPAPTAVEGRAGARAGQHVLRVTGPITLEAVAAFEDAVRVATDPALIIDLTEVPYIDSAALGALVHAYVSCQKAGRRLALVGLHHRVKAVMQLTRIDVLFTAFETLGEAEQALAQPRCSISGGISQPRQ